MRIRRVSHYKKRQQQKPLFRVNEKINVPRVRVIDEEGENIGEMDTKEALRVAEERGYDLIEVSPVAKPPVCRFDNWGSFNYQEQKKRQKQKANVKAVEVKGVRLSVGMKEHDLEVRKNQALKFFDKGHKVKIELVLRGREKAHRDRAAGVFKTFSAMLSEQAIIDTPLQQQGSKMFLILQPK
ncbi:MAG: translation initiation factor IF-3 [Candidatus Jacksonbacteria bacterium]|jgi:translation initiation factor IF-3|nr:translation initiation factor IF-3 [Candidatus Jacksonbacteria bacterium]MBT6034293.1 translation initiation factor IF-3 [Candidatus Jacksonbacteria bacterium]MBT6301306.1 translation initiation factor IF-3 [Candidatus Jacksonbacteria bacterium]MBT6756960.1 translation initiation factor IF-3 [Candidatus Jacksonbacteria bacterium]MBT6954937.1 translation initiation factor IF-3 [Candidatus Jacksonbacteria bacterium]